MVRGRRNGCPVDGMTVPAHLPGSHPGSALVSDSARHSQECLSLTDVPCGHPVSGCACAHTCKHDAHMCAHTHTNTLQTQKAGTDTFTHTHKRTHIQTHTNTQTGTDTFTHTQTHTCTSVYTHANTHTHSLLPGLPGCSLMLATPGGCLLELLLTFYNTPSSLCPAPRSPSLPAPARGMC